MEASRARRLVPRGIALVLIAGALVGIVPQLASAEAAPTSTPPIATEVPDPEWEQRLELLGSNDDRTQAVAPLPDGGALLVGNTINGSFGSAGYVSFGDDAVVVRVSASGKKVTTWGAGGVARLDTERTLRVTGAAVDAAGRAYVYGYDREGWWDSYDGLVLRLRANGTPDPTFGTNGIRTYHIGTDDRIRTMAFDPYGRPILNLVSSNMTPPRLALNSLVRLREDGAIDPTFGASGGLAPVAPADQSPGDPVVDMGIDPSGRITVATDRQGRVRRFTIDGTPDTSYGPDGVRHLPNGDGHTYSSAVRADGSVVATYWAYGWDGHENGTTVLVGLTPSGAADLLYGTTGRELQFPVSSTARVIDALPGGGVLMSTPIASGAELDGYSLVRVLATGALDPTFGALGQTPADASFVTAELGRNGRVWVGQTVWSWSTKSDLRLVALTGLGAVDPAFGSEGLVDHGEEEPHSTNHYTTVVDRQGRTLEMAEAGHIFWLVRLTPSGALDTTFGEGGKLRLPRDVGTNATFAVRDDGSVLVIPWQRTLYDYTVDGRPSRRFLGGPTRELPLLRHDAAWFPELDGATALSDGSVLVGGTSRSELDAAECNVGWIEKIRSDGTRDVTFGAGGRIDLESCTYGPVGIVVDRSAGTFTVAQRTYEQPNGTNEVVLSRHLLDGTPDPGFGQLGEVRESAARRVLQNFGQDAQGRVLTLTHDILYAPGTVEVRRYTPTGAIDTTYGTDGALTLSPAGIGSSIAVARDGTAVVLSRTTATLADPNHVSTPTAHRILPDGSFDPAWGGSAGVDPGSGTQWTTVTQDGDGFVVATNHERESEVHLRRFGADTRPTITGLSPTSGQSEGGETITIRGRGFTVHTTVAFGGDPALDPKFVSSRELRVVTPPGPSNGVQIVPVTVSDPRGVRETTTGLTFTYRPARWVAVPPSRLLDTRPTSRVGAQQPKPGPDGVVRVRAAGRAGVPSSHVAAVSLSVTGTEAEGDVYVTAWPCGEPRPTASNVNASSATSTAANHVLVAPGVGGEVCLFTSGRSHLIVDVLGWIPAGNGFVASTPRRLLDTRATGRLPLGTGLKVDVGSDNPGTVALNVTATNPIAAGWVTVAPCGSPSNASSLNVDHIGQTVANLIVTSLSESDEVCLYPSQPMDLVVDLGGWWVEGELTPMAPVRIEDTRSPGNAPTAGTVVQAFPRYGGVPATGVRTVFVNITATGGWSTGFVTVWPCSQPRPWTSNLNVSRPGQTVAVLAATALDPDGSFCVYSSAATSIVIDVTAWLP